MPQVQCIMRSRDRWEFLSFSKATYNPLSHPLRQANACRQVCDRGLWKSLDGNRELSEYQDVFFPGMGAVKIR